MDATKLTDLQLYKLLNHPNIKGRAARLVNEEFKTRRLSDESHLPKYVAIDQKSLGILHKVLIILFPFGYCIHGIIAAWYLRKSEIKKWRQVWWYLNISFALWIILVLVLSKYILSSE